MKWVNMYALARASGFVYFAAYVDTVTNRAVGWVTRLGYRQPYAYNVYYVGKDGAVSSDTRGTWRHAAWAVQGAVAADRPLQGVELRALVSDMARYAVHGKLLGETRGFAA